MLTCGWMVPCINNQECQPPMPIDVDMDDSAEREFLQFAREEVDVDTRHATPLVHNSSQKRKKKGATAARVRRRLVVDQVRVQTDMLLDSEDEEQMVQTKSRRRIVRARSTPRQAVGAPDGPPMVTLHHQTVKDFAATLNMTELQTIVTELLFRDQASFGYNPCDNPQSGPTKMV